MSACVVDLAESTDDESQFERYVACHPASTVYHSLTWRTIFSVGLGYRSWPLMARDREGRVLGVLTLYLVSSPAGRRMVAVPFRDRGGPLYDAVEALDGLLNAAKLLAAREKARAIVLKSLDPLPAPIAARYDLRRRDHWIRSVLPLAMMTPESLRRSIGPKTRNMLRQAERHGLVCRETQCDEAAQARWYELHLRTQQRLGVPAFPRGFFAAMLSGLRSAGKIVHLEVNDDRHPVAATILLLHAGTCIYGYSASSEEGLRQRANDLLLFHAISLAIARGFEFFDLGSDSPTQESLLFFKRKWGAIQAAIPMYATASCNAVRDSSERRYGTARSVLRHLPLPAFALLSARITRFLG